MRTTMSATEWRIHEELKLHAAAEGWGIPPRLLGRIARLAAHCRWGVAPGRQSTARERQGTQSRQEAA